MRYIIVILHILYCMFHFSSTSYSVYMYLSLIEVTFKRKACQGMAEILQKLALNTNQSIKRKVQVPCINKVIFIHTDMMTLS